MLPSFFNLPPCFLFAIFWSKDTQKKGENRELKKPQQTSQAFLYNRKKEYRWQTQK